MVKKDKLIYNTAMQNIFSTTTTPFSNPVVALSTLYNVRADRSYDVSCNIDDPDTFVIFRTLSGTGRIDLEGYPSIELNGDTVMISARSIVRRYRCSSEKWVFWWFKCKLHSTVALPYNTALDIPGAAHDEYHTNQCFDLLKDDLKSAAIHASAHLAALLAKWSWQWHSSKRSMSPHQNSISRVTRMMHDMLDKRFTVEMMADTSRLSVRRFRQVFEQTTGQSPKKYFDRLRLDTAAEMLLTTPFSIGQLAEKLGYSSQFHFSKAFKAYFGKPPSSFRAEITKNN